MADLPCPTCGSSLAFLEQYHRYYCHRCGQYAPEGYGERGAQRCPTCGGILSYITQYDRFYCYHCNTYASPVVGTPSQATPAAENPAAAAAPATSTTMAITPSPEPAEATLVAAATPAPTAVAPETAPEPAPTPAEPATPAPAIPPAEKPETPAPVEPSKEILALAHSKPAVVRVKIFALKKSELMELSKAYDLDPSGTKEELQERLLGYLHRLESEEEPEPEAETHPEPAATVGPTPELAKEPPPQKSVEPIATAPTSAAQGATAEEAAQPTESTPVAQAAVVPAPVVAVPAAEAAPAPRPAQHAEHPCPTCGRELTYIAQYNRWYCYYCQRYAPAVSRSKNACPTCGATMRWIDQHHRWWCDSCAKYASADLPAPATPAAEAAVPSAATAAAPARSVVGHRHGSPAGGAALAGLGLALYIVYAFFAYLAEMLGFVPPTGVTPEILNYLQFFGFLFLALGIIVGLYALRDRA